MTPARDPKQSFFVNQFEESWKRNQWRGIMKEKSLEEESYRGWRIIEKESLRKNHWGGIIENFLCKPIRRIMEETSMTRQEESLEEESYRRDHWGRHLGGIWEAPGDSRRLPDAPGSSRRLQEAPGGSRRPWKQKVMPLSARMQKLHLNFNFTKCFWG